MGKDQQSGLPRPRGARSFFEQEKIAGEVPSQFGTVASFDGTPIFFGVEGSGPPLVFCYGFACSALHWTYQIDYFRHNFRCIWLDYRGHRNSPLPEKLEHLTVDALVRDVEAVVKFLDVGPAVYLGHSMGVNIVLELARRSPDLVTGMVLANGTPRRPLETLLVENVMSPAFKAFSFLERNAPEVLNLIWNARGKVDFLSVVFNSLGFNKHLAHPDDVRTYSEQIAEFSPVVMSRLMEDYDRVDATPWLHELKQRTLVLAGAEDLITPPELSELMVQLMPAAELVLVEHGSHCTPLDLPELVNLAIEKFLIKSE